jgi:signal transduction histidine kinase
LSAFPEPVAAVDVTDEEVVVRSHNEAFLETFREPERTVARSCETVLGETPEQVAVEGDDQINTPTDEATVAADGHLTVQTTDGEQEYHVSFLRGEPSAQNAGHGAVETDGSGETATLGAPTGRFVWTPPPRDNRGRERLVELHGATRRMLTADTREEVATVAASTVENVLGFALTTVRLYDPETERLLPTAISRATEGTTPGERPAYERGETIQWEAFDGGEFLVFQDITVIDDDVNRTDSGSMLVAPIGDHGVLTMGTKRENAITETDLELARVFAANVEAAMDRVERETTLRERERELERQNERLDRFASVLSHDLRNPLNIASGYAEMARTEAESSAVVDAVEEIQTAVERMSTLVDQTLTLAREGARVDETEPVDVPRLARRLVEATTGQTPALRLDDGEGWTVSADPARLERILDNLLRNAGEHGGSDVAVRLGQLDDEPGFYVADDGPGIPPDRREAVFEYGTSFDDSTGLGLAVVAELTHAHGWAVSVEESRAGGARFVFRTDPDVPGCGAEQTDR